MPKEQSSSAAASQPASRPASIYPLGRLVLGFGIREGGLNCGPLYIAARLDEATIKAKGLTVIALPVGVLVEGLVDGRKQPQSALIPWSNVTTAVFEPDDGGV